MTITGADLRTKTIDQIKMLEGKIEAEIELMDPPSDQDKKNLGQLKRCGLELYQRRVQLENQALEAINAELHRLKPEIEQGISNLHSQIDGVHTTVSIIQAINELLGFLSRVLVVLVPPVPGS